LTQAGKYQTFWLKILKLYRHLWLPKEIRKNSKGEYSGFQNPYRLKPFSKVSSFNLHSENISFAPELVLLIFIFVYFQHLF